MSDPVDAPKHIGDDALDKRKQAEVATQPLSTRGFSAIMHREATLRASLRRAGPGDKGGMLGGLYLAPNMRRALAAMLRGEPVTAQERAALAHAVSLLPKEQTDDAAPSTAPGDVWSGLATPANSNHSHQKGSVRGLLVPIQTRQPVKADENHVLIGLGLDSDENEED